MLKKEAEWYLENLDQIGAFQKWIGVIESDLPKQIAALVKSAAEVAAIELNGANE